MTATREPLGTWENGPWSFSLYDTGRSDSLGKSELAYRISYKGELLFEGADYRPGIGTAIDSDAAAGGLIGFLSYDAEACRDGREPGDAAFVPRTEKHREILAQECDELALWAAELEGEDRD